MFSGATDQSPKQEHSNLYHVIDFSKISCILSLIPVCYTQVHLAIFLDAR